MTLFGYKTIHEGESAAVWSKNGKMKLETGPKRIMLVRQKLELLRVYYADEASYLVTRKRTGQTVITPGPASAFCDPLEDVSVAVKEAVFIDASEALVVYCNGSNAVMGKPAVNGKAINSTPPQAAGVSRRIVHGPARFVPESNEWVHSFSWSGVPKNGSKTTHQPGAEQFTALSTIPSQLYHNVNEVRTNDDTLITVKLMIFYELVNIETMLAATVRHAAIRTRIPTLAASVLTMHLAERAPSPCDHLRIAGRSDRRLHQCRIRRRRRLLCCMQLRGFPDADIAAERAADLRTARRTRNGHRLPHLQGQLPQLTRCPNGACIVHSMLNVQ